jgi:hypothetical protein
VAADNEMSLPTIGTEENKESYEEALIEKPE